VAAGPGDSLVVISRAESGALRMLCRRGGRWKNARMISGAGNAADSPPRTERSS
jgi:hypothetical protein